MRLFALIGHPLSHSFSKRYFTEKFEREGIPGCRYELFPLKSIEELPALLQAQPELAGLNVTIPYKQQVIPYLDWLDEEARQVGAVNCIRIQDGQLSGYNTDIYGFEQSLTGFLNRQSQSPIPNPQSLILGTGGAAQAVAFVLKKMGIAFHFVSRTPQEGALTYEELEADIMASHRLLINTTPLGMAPNVEMCPPLPYELLTERHLLYDLVYNPERTLFLKKGGEMGCPTCNGLEMLHLQAEKGWEVWTGSTI